MKYILLSGLLFSFLACTNDNRKKGPEVPVISSDSTVQAPQKEPVTVAVDTVPHNIQVDTVIHLAFAKDSTTLTAKGSLNKKSTPVICYLPVDRRVKLNARIIPVDQDLNIRFSQIIKPDGQSDGPFDRQLKYTLQQKGLYKLIIGPNLMAEGKRSGDFLIRLEAK